VGSGRDPTLERVKISVTVTRQDGTLVVQWPAVVPFNDGHAVEYLALHFRGHDRPTLETALKRGSLVAYVSQVHGTYTVHATITRCDGSVLDTLER